MSMETLVRLSGKVAAWFFGPTAQGFLYALPKRRKSDELLASTHSLQELKRLDFGSW